MWKFDYYSADHTVPGRQHVLQMYYILGENPTSACIPACKLHLGIAMHERTALFVEQASTIYCNLMQPSLTEISLLEITLSFKTQNLCLFW